MIKITFYEDENVKEYDSGILAIDIIKDRYTTLTTKPLFAKLNNSYIDLYSPVTSDGIFKVITADMNEALPLLRHSGAHIMAQAVKRLFKGVKFSIGPAIENGFYYDIDCDTKITDADFAKIEQEMENIIKENIKVVRKEMAISDAKSFFKEKGEIYKVEILDDLEKDGVKTVSVYEQGDFIDLCRGPHVPYTSYIKSGSFKIMSVAGAYWRGNVKNKMLQRLYGTLWASKDDLKNYLTMLSEAEKRDHRKLGVQMNLFHIESDYAPGAIFWHQKGWTLFNSLVSYMRNKQQENGYIEVSTPSILNKCLWETSGHWDKYRHNMYVATVVDEDTDFAVKPMNCPGGVLIYKQGIKSYKDLPIRMAEFGKVNRYEASGALHGLFRVREFTQDDAHIFCTPEQLQEESVKVIKLIMEIYGEFGFNDVRIKLSTRPEKRIGSDKVWDLAETALAESLKKNGYDFTIFEGEGAFYGPKLEFVLRDAIGRDWQCGTLQVDMNLPERFDIDYVGSDGQKHRPIMLHRALFGSIERFAGILIENYAGNIPFWISPEQIVIATVSENSNQYATELYNKLKTAGLKVVLDVSNEKISYKIRQHSLSKIPVICVIGDKEQENKTVTARYLGEGEKQETLNLDEFIDKMIKKK